MTIPELLLEGATSVDKLGAAVGAADLNGDGRSDLLAGVPSGDALGRAQAGLLLGLQGQPAGPNMPDLTIYGAAAGDRTGAALAVADVTGDGLADLILGAPRADPFTGTDAGRVSVLAGPIGEAQTLAPTNTPTTTMATATPTEHAATADGDRHTDPDADEHAATADGYRHTDPDADEHAATADG